MHYVCVCGVGEYTLSRGDEGASRRPSNSKSARTGSHQLCALLTIFPLVTRGMLSSTLRSRTPRLSSHRRPARLHSPRDLPPSPAIPRVTQLHHAYEAGDLVKWSAFTSVSTEMRTAKAFSQGIVLFEVSGIDVAIGGGLSALSMYPAEAEVLVAAGTCFRVHEHAQHGMSHVISIEAISSREPSAGPVAAAGLVAAEGPVAAAMAAVGAGAKEAPVKAQAAQVEVKKAVGFVEAKAVEKEKAVEKAAKKVVEEEKEKAKAAAAAKEKEAAAEKAAAEKAAAEKAAAEKAAAQEAAEEKATTEKAAAAEKASADAAQKKQAADAEAAERAAAEAKAAIQEARKASAAQRKKERSRGGGFFSGGGKLFARGGIRGGKLFPRGSFSFGGFGGLFAGRRRRRRRGGGGFFGRLFGFLSRDKARSSTQLSQEVRL